MAFIPVTSKRLPMQKKALEYKRAILLANPLLDADKIVAARFKVGSKARQIMTPSLGTQANNWSNQESAAREGFDAEIVELTNLRGDVQIASGLQTQERFVYCRLETSLGRVTG